MEAGALGDLRVQGYAVLERVFSESRMEEVARVLGEALESRRSDSVLRSRDRTYGARNLLAVFPEAVRLVAETELKEFARQVLGERAGVVRGLFFDKPPGRTWSLAWHRDKTIAVKRNDLPTQVFRCPTRKGGIAHVEAPAALLESMLTFRIHLDPMDDQNGPLSVLPGSHRVDDDHCDQLPTVIHVAAGDVMAMRPLLVHASSASLPGTDRHRRIIHLELAASSELPDGYEWECFAPL